MIRVVVVMIAAGPILRRLEPGAFRYGPLRDRNRGRQTLQGRCEPIAIDQHKPGLADLAALFRAQLQLVGIVIGSEQTRDPQRIGSKPTGDVAERPIGSDHISTRRRTAAADKQQQRRQTGRDKDAHTRTQDNYE